MNSPFANLFLALQQYIPSQVATIVHIDQDLGQLKTGGRPPVSFPCVLIDFEDFVFDNFGLNVQTAKGTVVFRLAFAPHSNSAENTPSAYLQSAINYYDIEWSLHVALQGWSAGDAFGSLNRTAATTQKRTDNYRVREIRYSLTFDDFSTKEMQTLATVIAVVSEEVA